MDLKTHSIYNEVYELSPKSLQEICVDAIVTDIDQLVAFDLLKEPPGSDEYRKQVFFIQNIDIPCRLAENLLAKLSERSMIRNDTLSIFSDSSKYHLRSVQLPEINMKLGGQELRRFSSFRLKHLTLGFAGSLNLWSVRKLSASFTSSRETLTSLVVNLYPAVMIQSGTMFDFFAQFPCLTNLHYETPIQGNHVTFTDANWNMLFQSCTQLRVLNFTINGSSKEVQLDSSLFLQCKNLQSLTLRSAFKSELALQTVKCVQSFVRMETLRCIDFSIDSDPSDVAAPFVFRWETEQVDVTTHQGVLANYINTFLRQAQASLSELESLDLSGIFRISDRYIQEFVDTHKQLRFLGLCMVNTKFCILKDVAREHSHIMISGCQIEEQIIVSLLKYPNRATYMREVLKGLFQVSATWSKRRPYVVKKVLEIIRIKTFRMQKPIMLAATACIFHLSKEQENISNELNVVLLSEIAQVTGEVLIRFLSEIQMVKNCLLIICTDRILQNATFDRVLMCRLCLECMILHGEATDAHVTRMAVAIISILACRISSEETANLVTEREMKLLLDIVQVRIDTNNIDSTLKFNLSALWNITDESPAASKLFFDLEGIEKYARMLEVFAGDTQIEQRVLGLINNIAEVSGPCLICLSCTHIHTYKLKSTHTHSGLEMRNL